MRRTLIIAIFAILCGSVLADMQTGYVRTIRRPGKKARYIDNVQISVKGITGSFRSRDNGKFQLELRPLNLKVGKPFSLSAVFKPGYALYDNNLQRVFSPETPIEIILKDLSKEAKDQERFARNMFKGSEARYKKKIASLDKQLKEGEITEDKYRRQLQEYQALFDKYQSRIDVIAKRYAGLDYENIDPLTEAINVALSNGDFQLADSLLNSSGSIDAQARKIIDARSAIDEKIQFGTRIVEEGEKEKETNRKDAERMAELSYAKCVSFLNEFQTDSAAYYLELRAELMPEDAAVQNEAGTFIADYLADYGKALDYYNRALAISREQHGEEHPDVVKSYNNIGSVYDTRGESDRALEYYGKALKISQKINGEWHRDVAAILNNMGLTYSSLGDYPRALEYYEKSLMIRRKLLSDNHPDVALSYNNVGSVYSWQGEHAKALGYYEKALKISQKINGKWHRDVATILNNMGLTYSSLGDYPRALEYYEKSLMIQRKLLSDNHPDVALSCNNIGSVYSFQEEYAKALEYYEEALKTYRRIYGEDHSDIALCYNNIGYVYSSWGDYSRALKYYGKSLKIRQKIFGEEHPYVATSYYNIGSVYEWNGDYPLALEYLEKALKIRLKIFGEEHPKVATVKESIRTVKESMEVQSVD